MQQEIKNKIAVITGAARGIGYAIAEQLLKEGAKKVVLLDIDDDQGAEAAKILNNKYGDTKVDFINADVTTDLEKTYNVIIDGYKTVDILVNCAGIADESNIQRLFDINVIALIEWSTKFFGHMRKDKGGNGGTILNISSQAAYIENNLAAVYSASKAAVLVFSKTIGHVKNYEVSGVSVIALCPGLTRTVLGNNIKTHETLTLVELNLDGFPWQDIDIVGVAAVEAITKGVTGSAWSVVNSKIQEVKPM